MYAEQNVDNAATFRIWPNDEVCKVYATNDFINVTRWQ